MKYQLRQLIKKATSKSGGWTLYAIAKEADVEYATLSRFVDKSSRGLSLESAEKLLEFFEVELTDGAIPKRG